MTPTETSELQPRRDGVIGCTAWLGDERDKRLMLAEDILSELATGYWVSVLDDNDAPVKERMGQRILNYWQTWDSPPNPSSPTAADGAGGAERKHGN